MKVLVLGGGGREHALCWGLARSPSVERVLCAPGNAGIEQVAELRAVEPTDPAAVLALARAERVDLVVVGPEAPLVAGVADALEAAGVPVFGPGVAGARIEGSKLFAKQVMAAAGVPTAGYWAGSDPQEARAALERFGAPYVVKADGLAAGKGVVIAEDRAEAERSVDAALRDGAFGPAGATLVIEEYLAGPEVSVFGLCDGEGGVAVLAPAQDYKRAFDGGAGPNTGGMGAYCPVPAVDQQVLEQVGRDVLTPVALTLRPAYRGVLYAGLVLTADGPSVLEFNARFGDPEAQVVLPRLDEDLGDVLLACARGNLAELSRCFTWNHQRCVTVVLASGGYPGAYTTGLPVTGLEAAADVPDTVIFHAGTRREGRSVVTDGGRVLAVSGLGEDLAAARAAAYTAADLIHFDGLQRREDIAAGL